MFATFALIVASLVSTLQAAPPREGVAWLSDRVDASTFACVGTVEEMVTVPFPDGIEADHLTDPPQAKKELRFARVNVERVLKGDPRTKLVFHEAWPTSAADTTVDAKGQRSLYLLGPGVIAAATGDDLKRAVKSLGSHLILRNCGDGAGIIPIQGKGAKEYVVASGLPDSLRSADGEKGPRLVDVATWIEALGRFSPDAATLHMRCERTFRMQADVWSDAFDVRVLANGNRRFAKRLGEHEIVVVDRMDPSDWSLILNAMRNGAEPTDSRFDESQSAFDRRIVFHVEDERFEFVQARDQDLSKVDPADRATVARALRVWTAMWDSLKCETCTDMSVEDRRLIERFR